MTRSRASKFGAKEMFECPLSPRMKLNLNNQFSILSPTKLSFQESVVSSKGKMCCKKVAERMKPAGRKNTRSYKGPLGDYRDHSLLQSTLLTTKDMNESRKVHFYLIHTN